MLLEYEESTIEALAAVLSGRTVHSCCSSSEEARPQGTTDGESSETDYFCVPENRDVDFTNYFERSEQSMGQKRTRGLQLELVQSAYSWSLDPSDIEWISD